MTLRKAIKKISDNCEKMRVLLDECVSLADQHKIEFETPWGGEGTCEAGIGGSYIPEGSARAESADRIGWNPSSESC